MLEAASLLLLPLIPLAVLYIANELYYRSVGFFRSRWTLLTAMVGTPVHELAHAGMVLLFGMKIQRMRLYVSDPESNTLGYVHYAYDPFSFVHRVGMVFVGLAPAIVGALLVSVLLIFGGLPLLTVRLRGFGFADLLDLGLYVEIWSWYGDLFAAVDSWSVFAALVVSVFIGTHASPSKADMRGVFGGALAVGAVFWLVLTVPNLFPGIPALEALSPRPIIEMWGAAMLQMSALAVGAALILSVVFTMLGVISRIVMRGR